MIENFVQETANAPGNAATVTLAGPSAGRRGIIAAFGGGATVYLGMESGTQWQIVEALTVAGPPQQITITNVLSNSAGTTTRLNFTGVVRIYSVLPAERNVYARQNGSVLLTGDLTVNNSGSADRVQLGSTGVVSWARLGSAIAGEGTSEIAFDRATGNVRLSTGLTGAALTERLVLTGDGLARLPLDTVNSTKGFIVQGGTPRRDVAIRPSMTAGANNSLVQAGDSGIIFDAGAVDTGAFVIAPWASGAATGLRIDNTGLITAAGGLRAQIAGAPTTGQVLFGNGTARLFWNGTKFDLNGPLDVNGSPVAPLPTASAGVGQWAAISASANTTTLPSGGTWAYSAGLFNSSGSATGTATGVAAGGTSIGGGATAFIYGFAWRIA